jgi:uncharacterized protein involved in exopolysaccharide biosynthesis
MNDEQDLVDLGDILGRVRRRSGWIAAGALAGFAIAVAVAFALPPRYQSTTKVLIRAADGGASPLSRVSGLADMLSIGGLGSKPFDTEMEVLTSRAVIGSVVDSLGLQARVTKPRATPVMRLVQSARWLREVPDGAVYAFARSGNGYKVEGPGAPATVTPGVPFRTGAGVLTLRRGGLPDAFTLRVSDYEDAVTDVFKRLDPGKPTGEVAHLEFAAADPVTAAAVPNALVREYLLRRRTTDRGVNAHRYEFLARQADSIGGELVRAEGSLRSYMETSGVVDPEFQGKATFERLAQLQGEAETIDVETRALERTLSAGVAPQGSDLAAYPTFFKNPAISNVLQQLLELRATRTQLLQKRTDRDPEVVGLTRSISQLEAELGSLSRAYLNGLRQQRAAVQLELARYRSSAATIPGTSEASLRLQREVKRLSETLIVLQTQLVQTRLAAIGEGGDVRQIDPAVPPKRPAFPSKPLFVGLGLFAGLLLGCCGALVRSYTDDRLRTAREIQAAMRVPALEFVPGAPLLVSGSQERGTVLVAAGSEGADTALVARQLAETASLRGQDVAFVDLTHPRAMLAAGSENGSPRSASTALVPGTAPEAAGYQLYAGPDGARWTGSSLRGDVEDLERRFARVVVALPLAESPAALALFAPQRPVVLVVGPGPVSRSRLGGTMDGLARLDAHPAALVLVRTRAAADA